ncbi:hypothetical protein O9K51_01447 [Purpureocillium lavendulum]|uniref:Secreted protein n=1 Tax=Purpureocillium lavendulum TaxID=1247861 RepID=A0AB34G6D3_9HYPO|nr:hypothetical protein O9K51_01447 [Purpureocillium lavendulum]
MPPSLRLLVIMFISAVIQQRAIAPSLNLYGIRGCWSCRYRYLWSVYAAGRASFPNISAILSSSYGRYFSSRNSWWKHGTPREAIIDGHKPKTAQSHELQPSCAAEGDGIPTPIPPSKFLSS